MTEYPFGSIVLARFPFTDLSTDKRRPALVVSRDEPENADLIVCFITSVARTGPHTASIPADNATGLKAPSVVRFDKIATLNASVISGRIGQVPATWLTAQRGAFLSVFGFDEPGMALVKPSDVGRG